MNNLKKALELYVEDTSASVSPAPVDLFLKEFEAIRKSVERQARWQGIVRKIGAELSGLFAVSISEFKLKLAHSPEIAVGTHSDGGIRVMVLRGASQQILNLELKTPPEIGGGGVLYFDFIIPQRLDSSVKQWEVALLSKSEQELVSEPQVVRAGIETLIKFELPADRAEEWRKSIYQQMAPHEMPFGLLLCAYHQTVKD